MQVLVDLSRCQAYGRCVYAAPDVFRLEHEEVLEWEYSPDDDPARAGRPGGGQLPGAGEQRRRGHSGPMLTEWVQRVEGPRLVVDPSYRTSPGFFGPQELLVDVDRTVDRPR